MGNRLSMLCGLAAILMTLPGQAQTTPHKLARSDYKLDTPVEPHKALGRVFFSESGWHSPADQHGIVKVYNKRLEVYSPRRIKRLPYAERILWIAKRYSTKTFTPDEVMHLDKSRVRSARQRWINQMGPDCVEPPAWPVLTPSGKPHAPWELYEDRCETVFRRADAFLRSKQEGTCQASAPIDHWGGPMDDWRALRAGWIRVDWVCVEGGKSYRAANHFWCDPGLSECEAGNEP